MSFIIAIHVSDGIVFASDSRLTYTTTNTDDKGNKTVEVGVHFTDSTPKTFVTHSNVGISYSGSSSIKNKPITGFIERFIEENRDKNVDELKDLIIPFFSGLQNDLNTTFTIGGYVVENGKLKQRLYQINTQANCIQTINVKDQGAVWSGEIDIMSRIINPVYIKKDDDTYELISQNAILWQYFTLQDAVDFARYAVKTTIDTMRFQSRVKTVGGPIDILVVKPTEAIWIEKRQLH